MKTAVSIPGSVFHAERLAKSLGIPRSQLYSRAIERYVSEAQQRDIIAWLNEVYANEKVELDPALAVVRWASLSTRTVVMTRGEIWWATLRDPDASEPGYRRPVLILQSDAFNQSAIQTVIVAVITSNLRVAAAPGNVMFLCWSRPEIVGKHVRYQRFLPKGRPRPAGLSV